MKKLILIAFAFGTLTVTSGCAHKEPAPEVTAAPVAAEPVVAPTPVAEPVKKVTKKKKK